MMDGASDSFIKPSRKDIRQPLQQKTQTNFVCTNSQFQTNFTKQSSLVNMHDHLCSSSLTDEYTYQIPQVDSQSKLMGLISGQQQI